MWLFKWSPHGRGLWIIGTRFMYERGGAALNNCGFVSTKDLARDFSTPFVWMFRMSMLGWGSVLPRMEKEKDQLPRILEAYEDRIKAVVFLPSTDHGYEQPPYEEITEDKYREMASKIMPISGEVRHERELEAVSCEGGLCNYSPKP
jgi:hypothetical protein